MNIYPILASGPFVKHAKTNILGHWPEDGSSYYIELPEQLVDPMIAILNGLHEKYEKLNKLQNECRELERFFDELSENENEMP